MDTFGDAIDYLRRHILKDTELPYLWEDEALWECFARAHDEFAERTSCIRDGRSPLTEVVMVEGQTAYPLDPAVLTVMSVLNETTGRPLTRASHPTVTQTSDILEGSTVAWLEVINAYGTSPGTPRVFYTDSTADTDAGSKLAAVLCVYPPPAATDEGSILRLRVTRLPTVRCAEDTLDEVPECPLQFLSSIVRGAAAEAYTMQDADGESSQRATNHRNVFLNDIERAKSVLRGKMHQPLTWGFNASR